MTDSKEKIEQVPSPDPLLRRIQKIALAVGLTGAAAVFLTLGRDASVGFMMGAILSMLTVRSWSKLASSLGTDTSPTTGMAAVFLVLRYFLIAGAIYAIVNNLGVSPVPLLVGLLVSLAAVVIALAGGSSK